MSHQYVNDFGPNFAMPSALPPPGKEIHGGPGGGGAEGIIRGWREIQGEVAGRKTIFPTRQIFLKFNLKIVLV